MPMNSGLYNAVRYVAFNADNDGASACTSFIYGIVTDNAENSIISVFMCPKALSGYGSQMNNGQQLEHIEPYSEIIDIDFANDLMFEGYKPNNYKLYTFPYICLAVDTLSCCTVYRWEWFKGNPYIRVRFTINGALSPVSEFRISPNNYCVESVDEQETESVNYTASNFITGFPQCAWAIDSYAAWMAQKQNGEYIQLASTTIGAVAAGFNLDIAGAAQGLLGVASQCNQIVLEQTRGDTPRGNIGGSVDTAHHIKGLYYKHMSVTKEYAEQIDSFFTRYGYCVNKIKKPSRHNRRYYTFVKTRDCQIQLTGLTSIPTDAVEKIKNIYNSGITFWTSDSVPGDYNQTGFKNTPLGGGGF